MKANGNINKNPQDELNTHRIDNKNMLDNISIVQAVAIDLILAEMCPDIRFMDTVASTNGAAHKKFMINFRKVESSSSIIKKSVEAVNNRH